MGKGLTGKDRNVIGTISFEVEIDGKPMPAFDEYLAPKIQKLVETEVAHIISEALDALEKRPAAATTQRLKDISAAEAASSKRAAARRPIKRPATRRPAAKPVSSKRPAAKRTR